MDTTVLLSLVVAAVVVSALLIWAFRKREGHASVKVDLFGAKAELEDRPKEAPEISAKGVKVGRDAKLAGAGIALENVDVGRDLQARAPAKQRR